MDTPPSLPPPISPRSAPPAMSAAPEPPPRGKDRSTWLIGCAIAAAVSLPLLAIVGLLAAIAIPSFVTARDRAQHNACLNNLRQLDGAKDQFYLEHQAAPYGLSDLVGTYIKVPPVCPNGGTYELHPLGENPTCSHHGDLLPRTVSPIPPGKNVLPGVEWDARPGRVPERITVPGPSD